MSKITNTNEKIEKTVVGGYKKIENTVVGGYKKIEDKFVDTFLKKDGETIEEAKQRVKEEQGKQAAKNKENIKSTKEIQEEINKKYGV